MLDHSLFPPLTTAAAEDVVGELERALDAHRRWIKRFQIALVCRTKPLADDLAADAHLISEFGRWYRHDAGRYVRRHPGFASVGEKHRAMHQIARRLSEAVADGETISTDSYRAFSESVDVFKLSVRALLIEAREFLRYTDPLTGVSNRATLMPRLEQEYQRVKRGGPACCMTMMDLDKFKDINDTYGHHTGDVVLKEVARYLLDNIRQYDLVYRYGGEEFVLLLPNTVPEKAKPLLDRIRRGLARNRIPVDGRTISVSASFGVAALSAEWSVKATIQRADEALYAAKDAGRNRVCIWRSPEEKAPKKARAAKRKPAKRKPAMRKRTTKKPARRAAG